MVSPTHPLISALRRPGRTPDRGKIVTAAEAVLQGRRLDTGAIEEASRLAADAADPSSDLRGSAEYKRDIVRVYVQRALQQAAGAGQEGMN